jgi:hypothetical protein
MSNYEKAYEEIRELMRARTIIDALIDAKQAEIDAMPPEEMVVNTF